MTGWVYKQTEPGLWTVGYYAPNGDWESDSDHGERQAARDKVRWLNGGEVPAFSARIINEANLEPPRELVDKFMAGQVISDLPADVLVRIQAYLDAAVRKWRESESAFARFYVDAFQCVRDSLLGAQLALEPLQVDEENTGSEILARELGLPEGSRIFWLVTPPAGWYYRPPPAGWYYRLVGAVNPKGPFTHFHAAADAALAAVGSSPPRAGADT
jgi:hypothetical protein